MGVWLLIAVLPFARADCGVSDEWSSALEQSILEARFADAQLQLDELDRRLACGEPVEPEALGRLWVAEGVLRHLTGDPDSASDAFRAAARVADDPWPDVFGADLERVFDEAVFDPVGGAGEIEVRGAEGFVTWLDGRPATLPSGAAVGLHAVQVVDRRAVAWAQVVYLSPQQRLVLEPQGLPEPTALPEPTLPAPVVRKSPVWLVAGGAALAVGVSSAGLALAETPRMQAAQTTAELEAAWARQRVFGVAAYSLIGVGTAGVTVHVLRR